ncbi:RNA ligase family protein [Armatimonas sp.]|uniref:RNA ligase family protein n=1 Tax=Armatimonas sp. TaxID=1872638 RepID=UPI00286D2C85|nr:RNA ligase family protein [Armatimonas sp.]
MLYYPKMPSSEKALVLGERCIAFEKLDGTNLHFCWERGFGWHAFGTRRDRFNLTERGIAEFANAHPELSEAAGVFQATLAAGLGDVLESYKTDETTAFCEFLGEGSFAGQHKPGEPKRLIFFDLALPGEVFVVPEDFVRDFGHLPIPRIVYRGKLTGQFTDDVRKGKLGVAEGVVCKGLKGNWRCKVKTDAYRERLKASLGADWESGWE